MKRDSWMTDVSSDPSRPRRLPQPEEHPPRRRNAKAEEKPAEEFVLPHGLRYKLVLPTFSV